MKGWVYVITNKAMPGIVKVGYSMKDPRIRAGELDNTGAPHPYSVEYEILVDEPFQIEQESHRILSENREGKEWFRCSIEEAVAAIRQVSGGNEHFENNISKELRDAEEITRMEIARKQEEQELAAIAAKIRERQAERRIIALQEKQEKEQNERREIERQKEEIENRFRANESIICAEFDRQVAEKFPKRPFHYYWSFSSLVVFSIMAIATNNALSATTLFLTVFGGLLSGAFFYWLSANDIENSDSYQALQEKLKLELDDVRYQYAACGNCNQVVRLNRTDLFLKINDGKWNCPVCKGVLVNTVVE